MGLLSRWSAHGRAESRRLKLAAQATATPGAEALAAYLTTPPPEPDTDIGDLPLLAVDMETTGLDPRRDRLLSIGFVALNGLEIDLSTAVHLVIRQEPSATGVDQGVGQSATVHHLTDDALAAGVPLREAIERLLMALTGRAMLVHFSDIETGFLDAACQRLYGVGATTTCIDTLELHRRLLTGGGDNVLPAGALRLAAARQTLGLPRYGAHEALTDALACAELYLAQVVRLGGEGQMPLKRLV
ncbi:MAG: exonuclease domain-containing protein [Dermatophilus congolensis]|nr:exonuclease domain-containing protein [Dermatophilus congolensis]